MAKTLELLLTENVDNLGIVGDVVKVRQGYARNYLLPRQLATTPSEEMIKSLQAKRVEAEKMLAEERKVRATTVEKLAGHELHLTRSCNDQGVLYAGVTQQEIAAALNAAGFGVRPRDVRLHEAIKRVDTYDVHIKFDTDLETHIKLWVLADRKLDQREEEREEMEFDNEGNLILPKAKRDRGAKTETDKGGKEPAEAAEKPGKHAEPAAEEPKPAAKAKPKVRADTKAAKGEPEAKKAEKKK